jgi:DNA-binding CsgD family transcriptional regulator/type II secretory pathway predicted ATPase ExeA
LAERKLSRQLHSDRFVSGAEGVSVVSGWPFVARDEEMRMAMASLEFGSECRGVALVGEAGVGKTTLARALADSLASDEVTARFVWGTQTGQAVPLGAFHRSLHVDDPHEPAVMLAAAHRALIQEKNLVLLVDDAQWLDPLSALLLEQLAVSGTIRIVTTIRAGEPVPDAVTALWKERYLSRLDIAPFTRAQTGELVAAALDGAVDDEVADHLHDLASGSPLVLRGLLNAAIENSALVERAGMWRLQGPLRVGADLNDLLVARLEAMPPDELEVVEIIAAAEVLDWDILRALCSTASVARAERRGAIQFLADGSHTVVRLGHPILGEVALRRSGTARSRQLNGLLAEQTTKFLQARVCDVTGADARKQIQLAQFMMRSDMPPDLDGIIQAAASAVTMSNLVLGEQLARFAFDRGAGLPAVVILADAISWQGRGEEAEALLNSFDPDGLDELMTVRWGSLRAANLFWGCGQLDAARAVLATVRHRVSAEEMLGPITAMEVSFAFFANDLPTAITTGLDACATDMMPMATVWATMATASALALSGRFAEARSVAERGAGAAQQCESGPQRFAIGLGEILALTAAGDLAEADRVCARYSAMTGGAGQAEAIVGALIGRLELARGRQTVACEALRKSLSAMSQAFPAGWVMLVAAWSAQAEAACGNAEAAAISLTKAEEAAGPQVAVFMPELELARAWERASVGETTAARTHAERAALAARRGRMSAVEMIALHTGVRFGDRSNAARLQALAHRLDGPLAAAIAEHARGLADHDGERLDAAGQQFQAIGAMAMAADASAQAAREYAHSGSRVKELECALRAHWLASQYGLCTPATTSIASPLPITDREREIATLVAGGLSNRQIGERLCLSIRTVEGHLYRIFAKLGIDYREELAHLMRVSAAN